MRKFVSEKSNEILDQLLEPIEDETINLIDQMRRISLGLDHKKPNNQLSENDLASYQKLISTMADLADYYFAEVMSMDINISNLKAKNQLGDKLIEISLNNVANIYYMQAVACFKQGDNQTALVLYRESLRVKPDSKVVRLVIKGMLLIHQQDASSALLAQDYPAALVHNLKALEVAKAYFGETSQIVSDMRNDINQFAHKYNLTITPSEVIENYEDTKQDAAESMKTIEDSDNGTGNLKQDNSFKQGMYR